MEIKGNCTFINEVFNKYKTNIVVQTLEMYHLCFGSLYRFFRPFCKVIFKGTLGTPKQWLVSFTEYKFFFPSAKECSINHVWSNE